MRTPRGGLIGEASRRTAATASPPYKRAASPSSSMVRATRLRAGRTGASTRDIPRSVGARTDSVARVVADVGESDASAAEGGTAPVRVALTTMGDPGHLFPVLGLAAALHRHGHPVLVVTAAGREAEVRHAGAELAVLPEAPGHPPDGDFGALLWERPAESAEALAALLERWSPDVVVADTLTRAGAYAAELIGLPWVELIPHHLMDPSPHLPPLGLGRRPASTPWRRRSDRRLRARQAASVAASLPARRAARVRIGLSWPDPGPAARLVATPPGLEWPRPDWPAHAHIVGPLPYEPPWPDLEVPPGDEPLVLVTDSTAAPGREGTLVTAAATGLAAIDVRLVLTAPPASVPQRTDAPRVRTGRGRHGPLLDRAAVAVGPGGSGFVGKALARGVPLVVVPAGGDQRETAARVEASGAGLALRPARATSRRLRDAVVEVLRHPAYARAARRLARGVGTDGPHRAVAVVRSAGR